MKTCWSELLKLHLKTNQIHIFLLKMMQNNTRRNTLASSCRKRLVDVYISAFSEGKLSQQFTDVSVRRLKAEKGWGQYVWGWCGVGGWWDGGKRMQEGLFTAVLGKYSIYKRPFRKITSCISPCQSNNLSYSLFIYSILHMMILHTIHDFSQGRKCDLEQILSLPTFQYLRNPSLNSHSLHIIKR